MKIEEGYMPFLGYKTYYRIVGTAGPAAPTIISKYSTAWRRKRGAR